MNAIKKICEPVKTDTNIIKAAIVLPAQYAKPNVNRWMDFFLYFQLPHAERSKNIGVTTIKQLSRYREKEIMSLHGMGPSSLPKLRAALKEEGLGFKK